MKSTQCLALSTCLSVWSEWGEKTGHIAFFLSSSFLHARTTRPISPYYPRFFVTTHAFSTVCPDLTRERYTHNANSSTYVRIVARANQRILREPQWTADTLRCARNHSRVRAVVGVVCVTFACQIWTHWFSTVLSFRFQDVVYRVEIQKCVSLDSVQKRREADDNFKFTEYEVLEIILLFSIF